MKKQRGMGFLGIFLICAIIVLGAVGGMKIAPAYIEFNAIKNAIFVVRDSGATSIPDIKRAFEKQVDVNNIHAISSTDLEITRDGPEVVIAFAYPVKIHMFYNVSVWIDFVATTASSGVTPEARK